MLCSGVGSKPNGRLPAAIRWGRPELSWVLSGDMSHIQQTHWEQLKVLVGFKGLFLVRLEWNIKNVPPQNIPKILVF